MTTVGQLHEFCPESESLTAYVERVELFFTANDIAAQKKVPVFLSAVGGTTYGLLRNLLAPTSPKDKSFDEIVKVLKAHFEPKPVVIAERFHFHRRDQAPAETVAVYVAELRRLATTCDFGDYLDQALRDRFVCGLRSEAIQKSLLSETELDFVRAVKVAQGMEAAHKNTQTLKGPEPTVGKVEKVTQSPKSAGYRKAAVHSGEKPNCYRCGRTGHLPQECGFKEAVCYNCRRKGHLAKVCRSPKTGFQRGGSRQRMKWISTQLAESQEMEEEQFVHQIGSSATPPYQVQLTVNNKPVIMEVDTGAAVSLMSYKTYQKLFASVPLEKTTVKLSTFTSESIPVVGQMTVDVRYGSQRGAHQLYIVKGSGPSLLGRDWLQSIRLNWASIKTLTTYNSQLTLHQVVQKYAEVFRPGLGTLCKFKAHLKLKEGACPRFFRPRPVPFALKEAVEKEIERLEKSGSLQRVEHSDWASPIVPVPKKDGTLRLCGDFKVSLNGALEVDQYPLP